MLGVLHFRIICNIAVSLTLILDRKLPTHKKEYITCKSRGIEGTKKLYLAYSQS